MKFGHKLICTIIGCLSLIGCNGSSSSTDSTAQTGTFIDSAVSNIDYKTASHSGVTDTSGKFTYESGESITFSIGTITFPPVTATNIVTPLTIAQTTDVNDDTVINISRFLQTIDSDGDPSNGITIADELKAANSTNSGTIDFTADPDSFATNNVVTNVITDAGATELVTRSNALTHLATSLEEEGADTSSISPSILGTWLAEGYVDEENYSFVVFMFLDNDNYFMAQLDVESGAAITSTNHSSDNDDSWSGFEFAKYSLDSSNELLKTEDSTLYDDNGRSGLTSLVTQEIIDTCSANPTEQCNEYDHVTVNFSSPNEMTFNVDEFEDGGLDSYYVEFKRQVNTSENPLIGSWLYTSADTENGVLLAFVFTDDNHYFHMEYNTDPEVNNSEEPAGLEVGTYTLSSWTTTTVNGKTQHSATLTPTVMIDLNGEYGLSDTGSESALITIIGDTMTLTVADGAPEFIRQ